jgi:hypothetical protein
MRSRFCAAVIVVWLAGSMAAQQTQPAGDTRPPAPAPQQSTAVPAATVAQHTPSDAETQLFSELLNSARAGDHTRFAAALSRARKQKSEPQSSTSLALPVFEDLDRLWTFSRTNRVGAFLSESTAPELLKSLRRYDGFETAMRPLTIRAAGGVIVYPAVEARAFLIDRARDVARGIRFASPAESARRAPASELASRPRTEPKRQVESTSRRKPASPPPSEVASPAPVEVSKPAQQPEAAPAVATAPPAVAPAASPFGGTTSSASAASETGQPVSKAAPSTAAGALTTSTSGQPTTSTEAAPAVNESGAGKSAKLIFFIVLAIVAVGALVLMVRTTRPEAMPSLTGESTAATDDDEAEPATGAEEDEAISDDDETLSDDPQQVYPIHRGRRRRRKR